MVSKYNIGANFERQVVKHLEKQGYLAFRCAGSKGEAKVDIVALAPLSFYEEDCEEPKDLLIQCKLSGIASKFEREQLTKAAENFGCLPVIASKVSGKIQFTMLNKEQIKQDLQEIEPK